MSAMLVATATAFSVSSASAAEQCAAHADMIRALGEQFHQNAAALGVVNPNIILEVFVSKQGTWTILATDTRGQSCVISSGEGWDSTMAALPGA